MESELHPVDPTKRKRPVLVLATLHQFQGPRFSGFVEDASYGVLVEQCIRVREIEFVFEEAGKDHGPSIAEERSQAILGAAHYVNLDCSQDKFRKFGIAGTETEISHWIDDQDKARGKYSCQDVGEHKNREVQWLEEIQKQQFEKALVICGVGHGLSLSFRLQPQFTVELVTYLPHEKLCTRPHAE